MSKIASAIIIAVVLFGVGLPTAVAGDSGKIPPASPEVNQAIEDARLLAFLNEQCEKDADLKRIDQLVEQLGADEFEKREEAARRLVGLGTASLSALKKATSSDDAEIARRSTSCLEAINNQREWITPLKAVRRLVEGGHGGTVEALLKFLPYNRDPEVEEEIYFGLDALLQRETVLDAALTTALTDKSPARRAVAGLLVGRYGDNFYKSAVAKLLNDAESMVRLRSAQGLLGGCDKSGIPTLIGLLEKTPTDVAWQAEELLHYAAGDGSPKATVGSATDRERKACREAWERWWREQGDRLSLEDVAKTNRRPKLILAFEELSPQEWTKVAAQEGGTGKASWNGRIWLCGGEGEPRCQPYTPAEFTKRYLPLASTRAIVASGSLSESNLQELGLLPHDATGWERGTEKSPDGKERIQWVNRLRNGNRIIAAEAPWDNVLRRIVELDREGRTIWEAPFANRVSALVVLPIIRVGFQHRGERANDLESLSNRIQGSKSKSPMQRCSAIQAFGQMPNDETTFRAVIGALEDENHLVRLNALEVLSHLTDNPPWHSRICKDFARWKREGPRASKVIPILIRCLDDPDESIRWKAIDTLGFCGPEAGKALIAICRERPTSEASRRRVSAFCSLIRLATYGNDKTVDEIIRRAFRDEDSAVRRKVAEQLILITYCEYEGFSAVQSRFSAELAEALEDPCKETVEYLESYFCVLDEIGAAAVPHFLKLLEDPKRRTGAIWTLSKIGRKNPDVLPAFLALLNPTADKETAGAIAQALQHYVDPKAADLAVPILEQMLKDDRKFSTGTRSIAIHSLRCIGPAAQHAVPLLVEIAKTSPKEEIREEATQALQMIDSEVANQLRQPKFPSLPPGIKK